uniref:N-terminal methionine N(alpha)-acetyltransferase NatE n=1 Tax=Caenorhabditis tropicalis TaxID=1561998 RepID=A0A1I7TL73_9PELO
MLIKHIIQFAQETEDIEFLKTFVKDEWEAAARLFERLEFDRFPFPEQFGDYTGSLFCKTIVAEVAEETRIEETQGVQPLDLMFDVKSFDVEKLDALNHSLVIEDVTQDTVETLKELNIEISPVSNTDEFFKDVLKTSNFARLALFDGIPVGFIFAEKKFNSDGSSHLFIGIMGVKAEKQRHGIAGMLIKHIIQFAQETEDIKFLKTFVKDECEAAARLFERCEFDRFPFPEQFGDYTGSFFCKSTQ